MKFYFQAIASLILAVTIPNSQIIALPQLIIAQEIDLYIKKNIAREISVKIGNAENSGSGVIIAKQDDNYLILTNAHVLRDDNIFIVHTHDGVIHQAKPVINGIKTDDDLALLEFKSNKSYQTATINIAATPKAKQAILAVGYDAATGELLAQEGKIEQVPNKILKGGYSISYFSNVVQGMSGGAILNTDGEVIGINGKSAFPIVNTGYVFKDGTRPNLEEIKQYRQLNWGLEINRLLTQVNSDIITLYNLPLQKTSAKI